MRYRDNIPIKKKKSNILITDALLYRVYYYIIYYNISGVGGGY